jgi:hypothetical protein
MPQTTAFAAAPVNADGSAIRPRPRRWSLDFANKLGLVGRDADREEGYVAGARR